VHTAVAADVTDRHDTVVVPVRRHRRRALLLAALGAFQLWMWGTRLWNMLQEAGDFSAAFVGVHVALFTTGVGAGIVLGVLAWRFWREATDATSG
jgi:hypothetical protein